MSYIDLQMNTLLKWVNVRLAPSEIHGIGVFAVRDIKEGEKLYMDIMPEIFKLPYKKLSNNMPAYIHDLIVERWPTVKDDAPFVFPDARYTAYCNHSDEANYDAIKDVALRDITKGEEITEDYRLIKNSQKIYSFLNK